MPYDPTAAAVLPFLPSLERAFAEVVYRGNGEPYGRPLPTHPPQASHRLAALVVGVRATRKRRGQLERIQTVDLYLPAALAAVPALFALEPTLEETMTGADQPDPLRCHDLRPVRFGAGPYRAASRERQPDFHGFSFGSTIDLAIEGLRKTLVGVEPKSYTVAAFARPLLWLDYGAGEPSQQLVLYAASDGTLRVFVGSEPPSP